MENGAPENSSKPKESNNRWAETENLQGIIVEIDAVGDTTVRPIRSPILLQIRPDEAPRPADSKSDSK